MDEHASPATVGTLIDGLARHGDRLALLTFRRGATEEQSYAELAARVAGAALALRSAGLEPGRAVAFWAPNSPEWIAAYFAVLRSGGVAVPVDAQLPADSFVKVLEHARPDMLVTTAARAKELERFSVAARVLCLDDASAWPHAAPDLELPALAPEQTAALLYTSGTTGTPKAVPLTHRNFAANVSALLDARLIGPDDRVLLPLPLHHTYPFTVGLLTPLGTGASVILPAGISGPELSAAAERGRATVLLAVPRLCEALYAGVSAAVAARGRRAQRLFELLLRASIALRRATGLKVGKRLFGAVHERLGRSLRLIGCGGAKLPPDLAWRLEGLGWTVLTGYGLTETSPVLTFNEPKHSRLGTEGRPLRGVELRIAPAEDTKLGEILARGPSVFSGYLNNEAATAGAFTEDGWFRTGDLGWLDDDGFLHVEGRSKELIVLADGKKIFPEDVEKLYMADDLIGEVALLERNGRLAALIVPNDDEIRRRGALRVADLLRETLDDITARLPPYQRVVEYRVTRTPLPRTQLGKLKRHLLPALYDEAAAGPRAAAAPLSDADRSLLGTERGAAVLEWLKARFPDRPLTLDTSPQLDLEIDSLGWVGLTLEIERKFGVSLDAEAVSRIVTLRDLLNEIERASGGAGAPAATAKAAAHAPAAQRAPVEFAPPGRALRAFGALLFGALRAAMRLVYGVRVDGAENVGGVEPLVIAPNHTSYLDPLALAAVLPWRRLRRTYWAGWVGIMYTNPVMRLVSRATQVIPVDPDRDLTAAIRTAEDLLRRGYSVVWFPEGRRSPTGRLGRFQEGVGRLVTASGAPALPTAIVGTFEAWPKHRRLPRRHPLRITFGTPVRPTNREADDAPARTAANLERAVRALLESGATPTDISSSTDVRGAPNGHSTR